MIRLTLLTPWAGDGTEEKPFKPQILVDYPIKQFKDVTGSYNFTRNFFMVECTVTDSLLEKIRRNSRYFILGEKKV
jgi:hypothetical protein